MKVRCLDPTPENITKAATLLRQGGVVGMPTETVYGLAGICFNETALTKIFAAKERPSFDPLIVHVSNIGRAGYLESGSILEGLTRLRLIEINSLSSLARTRAEALLRAFWPGPFTLIMPKASDVPDLTTSGLPTVAIRMPRHPVAQALIEAVGLPLAAPSANRFGRISPTSAEDVAAELGDRIDLILDGGKCEVGLESTVVALQPSGGLIIMRPGGISIADIEEIVGRGQITKAAASGPVASPGMLSKHYAPHKPMILLPGSVTTLSKHSLDAVMAKYLSAHTSIKIGLLLFSGESKEKASKFSSISNLEVIQAISLSPSGDIYEAARELFRKIRYLDSSSVDIILAEPCPIGEGLGIAISDRLRRGARHT